MEALSEEDHERTLPELLRALAEDLVRLARQDVRLAGAELRERARRIGLGVGLLALAAVVALLLLGTLTAAAVLALSLVVPAWLAALLTAVVHGVVVAVLALVGRSMVRSGSPLLPVRALETMKEDARWASARLTSVARSS